MAKKKVKKQSAPEAQPRLEQPRPVQQPVSVEQPEELFDLRDPDSFRRAFIASEILNRKY